MAVPKRELLVLRHAKSAWDTGAPTDFDRPLAKRGRRDAPRMGRWILDQGLVPDCVVSSPATRARQTAELVLGEIGLDAEAVRWDERVYDAGVADLLAALQDCAPECRRVLLIGHNPGLESLVRRLGGSTVREAGPEKFFPTAALAHLVLSGDWEDPGTATAAAIVRPKTLRD